MKKMLNLAMISMFVLVGCSNVNSTEQDKSILEETHIIHKSEIIGDSEWYEIRTQVDDDIEKTGLYEIWLAQGDKQPVLIDIFDQSFFSTLEWEENKENGINVNYWNGGPEGGISTNIVYDQHGAELVRTTQERPWKNYEFVLKMPNHAGYNVAYLTEGNCMDYMYEADRTDAVEVMLMGISISYGTGVLNFLLPEVGTIECQLMNVSYYNPPIEITEIREDSLVITLSDGKNVTMDYYVPVNEYGITRPGLIVDGVILEPEIN